MSLTYVNADIGHAYFTLQQSTLWVFFMGNGKQTKAVMVEPLYDEVINWFRQIM